jgi:hypothetical protein
VAGEVEQEEAAMTQDELDVAGIGAILKHRTTKQHGKIVCCDLRNDLSLDCVVMFPDGTEQAVKPEEWDLVMAGPHGRESLDFLRQQRNPPVVREIQ